MKCQRHASNNLTRGGFGHLRQPRKKKQVLNPLVSSPWSSVISSAFASRAGRVVAAMSSSTTREELVTADKVRSEIVRICTAQPGHFIALFFLLLFPLSFVSVVYRFLLHPALVPPSCMTFVSFFFPAGTKPPLIDKSDHAKIALYLLTSLVFTLLPSASIAHSTFHGFHGKRLSLISSLKSCLTSFFPLLATFIASQLVIGLVVLAFGGFSALLFNLLPLFGVEIDSESGYFNLYETSIRASVLVFFNYFQSEWYLANAVVVVESDWGFSPLTRSSLLVKGMRGLAFPMMFFHGLLLGVWPPFRGLGLIDDPVTWESLHFGLIVRTVILTIFMAALMASNIMMSTMLFIYCKTMLPHRYRYRLTFPGTSRARWSERIFYYVFIPHYRYRISDLDEIIAVESTNPSSKVVWETGRA